MSATGYCRTNSPADTDGRPARSSAALPCAIGPDSQPTASRRRASARRRRFSRFDLGQPLRDDPAASPDVIESGHDVVESDRHDGQAEIVGRGRGQHFQLPSQIVAPQARRPALKRRQIAHGSRPASVHPSREFPQAVRVVRRGLEVLERIGRHERPASQHRVRPRAVEKQAVRQPGPAKEHVLGAGVSSSITGTNSLMASGIASIRARASRPPSPKRARRPRRDLRKSLLFVLTCRCRSG